MFENVVVQFNDRHVVVESGLFHFSEVPPTFISEQKNSLHISPSSSS